MRAPPPGAGTLRLVVHNLWEVLVCAPPCSWTRATVD
jgi:hypothetical protein